MNRERIRMLDILAYCCIVFAAMVSLSDSLNIIALYVAIPVSFVICFVSYNTLSKNKYLRILLTLYIWLCFSAILAEFYEPAIAELKRILGCFILSYAVASQAKNSRMIPWLYFVYFILLLFAWKYAGENILDEIIVGEERVNDEKLNANHLAYYTFYVTIAIYILGDILKGFLRKIVRIGFCGTIVLAFVTAILTASRQVLILQIPLYFILVFVRYFISAKKNNMVRFAIVAILGIGLFFLYNNYGVQMYGDSLLKQRSEVEVKDDIRMEIAQEAIAIATESPIVGHGPGNSRFLISSRHITHNTFLELLVNSGIIGFIIFSYMLLYFIKIQYIRWKRTKDQLFLVFLIFGLFWIVDQLFYVFYFDLWLISFFVLVATHSDTYYKNHVKA